MECGKGDLPFSAVSARLKGRTVLETFPVSDGKDLSTLELIRKTARAMGKRARLSSMSPALARIRERMIGKGAEVERLIWSPQVDMSHTCETLGWRPPVSVDEGIRRCVGRPANR